MCLFLVVTLILVLKKAGYDFNILLKVLAFILVVLFFLLVCFVFCLRDRDVISTFDLDSMSKKRHLRRLVRFVSCFPIKLL